MLEGPSHDSPKNKEHEQRKREIMFGWLPF